MKVQFVLYVPLWFTDHELRVMPILVMAERVG